MTPGQRSLLLSSAPSLLLRSLVLLSLCRESSHILLYFSIGLVSLCNFSAHLEINLSPSVCNLMKLEAILSFLFIFLTSVSASPSLFIFDSPHLLRHFSLSFSLTTPWRKIIYEREGRDVHVKRKEDMGRREWRKRQLADL